MGKLFSHLASYRRECILAPLFKLLEAVLELFVPLVVASIIDTGIATGNRPYVVRMVLVLFALALTGLAVSVTAQYFSAKAASLFSRDAKKALFEHIETFSLADCEKIGLPTLINRMTGDMNQVQSGVNMTLRLLLRSPFVVLGAAIMAFIVDARAALVFAVAIPVLAIIVYLIMRVTVPRFRAVQGDVDELLSQTRENYKGARVIRAFNLQDKERESFHGRADRLFSRQISAAGLSALTNPLTSLVVNLGIIVLIWYGGVRVDAGSLSQGAVVALFNYMSQILVELIKLASLIQTMTRALASARRVGAIFDMTSSMEDGTRMDSPCDGPAIEFSHVGFSYNKTGGKVLEDISFTLERGQTLGIIGATGSGKSTIAALMARLYDVDEGEVRILGCPIKSYRLQYLHDNVTLVLQKARLFRGTILDNLKLADSQATMDEVKRALSDAQALDFVMDKGFEAPVETGGRNFSGGQRQRLSIARALVHGGQILILDDSFSALDYKTDSLVRGALAKRKDITKVIISQRSSSVMSADRIILLDNGRIAAMGTHSELMATSPIYREIHYTQFEKEDADV